MPGAELTKLQTERTLNLVPYAYERSAFYREVWDAAGVRPGDIRDLDDFARRIPTITRETSGRSGAGRATRTPPAVRGPVGADVDHLELGDHR